jgi:hypothetical protein
MPSQSNHYKELNNLHKDIHETIQCFTNSATHKNAVEQCEIIMDALTAVVSDIVYSISLHAAHQQPEEFAYGMLEAFNKYANETVRDLLKKKRQTLQ